MILKCVRLGEKVPPKRTKAYKGEGDQKSMNIEGTYFLNGPIES